MANFDFETAAVLGKFLATLESRFGSVGEATMQLGLSNYQKRYRREEFVHKLKARQLASEATAKNLFYMLAESMRWQDMPQSRKMPAVSRQCFEWLEQMGPWLPRPFTRVSPGTLAEDSPMRGEGSDSDPDHGGLSDCDEGSMFGGVSGGGSSCGERGNLYQKLHEEALEYHRRRDEREENLKKPSRKPLPTSPVISDHLERLHLDHERRLASHETRVAAVAKEAKARSMSPLKGKKPEHDKSTIDRLLRPRKVKPQLPPDPPLRPPPDDPEAGTKAAERCWARAQATEKRRRERRVKAEKERIEEELALRSVGANTKLKDLSEVVRRLGEKDVERRRNKITERTERKQAAEEEEKAQLHGSSSASQLSPREGQESCHRMYLDHYRRAEALEKKRLEQEVKELEDLQQSSIHKSPPHRGEVFRRLFVSYDKHIGPDGVDRTTFGNWYKEPLDPQHPDYGPDEGPYRPQIKGGMQRPSTAYAGIRNLYEPRPYDLEAKSYEEVVRNEVENLAREKIGVLRNARDERVQQQRLEEELNIQRMKRQANEWSEQFPRRRSEVSASSNDPVQQDTTQGSMRRSLRSSETSDKRRSTVTTVVQQQSSSRGSQSPALESPPARLGLSIFSPGRRSLHPASAAGSANEPFAGSAVADFFGVGMEPSVSSAPSSRRSIFRSSIASAR